MARKKSKKRTKIGGAIPKSRLVNTPKRDLPLVSLLDRAIKHQNAGRVTDAQKIYRRLLVSHPDNPDAYNLLGSIELDHGHLDLAAQMIGKALELNPDHLPALCNMGLINLNLGNLERAEYYLSHAIQIKPDHTKALINLGIVKLKGGSLDAAEDNFREAITIEPNTAEAHNNLGAALERQSRYLEAEECYRKAASINPLYSEAVNNLTAVQQRSAAASMEPSEPTKFERVKGTRKLSDPSGEGGLTLDGGESHLLAARFLERALQHQTAGRIAQAEDIYLQILDVDPNHPEANHLLGLLAHQNGDHDGAVTLIEKAIKLKPGFYEAYNNLGAILMVQDRPKDAEESFRHALAIRPDYQEAQNNLDFLLGQKAPQNPK